LHRQRVLSAAVGEAYRGFVDGLTFADHNHISIENPNAVRGLHQGVDTPGKWVGLSE
jgi:hypothetical protein